MTDIRNEQNVGQGNTATSGTPAGERGTTGQQVDASDYSKHFQDSYQSAQYYDAKRNWNDYQPAYQYGYDTYGQYRGQRFEDVESQLERNWDNAKSTSSMAWKEVKDAVRDGWNYLERAMPGDADRDGR